MLAYVFTKTWKLAIVASVSENEIKEIMGFMLEGISLKELYISESSEIRELHETSYIRYSTDSAKVFYDHAA